MKYAIPALTVLAICLPALAESISSEEAPAQVIQTGGSYDGQRLPPVVLDGSTELPKRLDKGFRRLIPETAQEMKEKLKKNGYCELDREGKRFEKDLRDSIVIVEREDGKFDLMSANDLLSSGFLTRKKLYKRLPKEELHFFSKCEEPAPSV